MMEKVYALVGEKSKELLTYDGKVLVHWDSDELAYLVPRGAKVKQLDNCPEQFMHISQHPQLRGLVQWPLDRGDFR